MDQNSVHFLQPKRLVGPIVVPVERTKDGINAPNMMYMIDRSNVRMR